MAVAVVVLLDELSGLDECVSVAEQVGAVEVEVGKTQRHRTAFGNQLRLGEHLAGLALQLDFAVSAGHGLWSCSG